MGTCGSSGSCLSGNYCLQTFKQTSQRLVLFTSTCSVNLGPSASAKIKLLFYSSLRASCLCFEANNRREEREREEICLHIMRESKQVILKWVIKEAQMPQVFWLDWLKSLRETDVVWNVMLIEAILCFFLVMFSYWLSCIINGWIINSAFSLSLSITITRNSYPAREPTGPERSVHSVASSSSDSVVRGRQQHYSWRCLIYLAKAHTHTIVALVKNH